MTTYNVSLTLNNKFLYDQNIIYLFVEFLVTNEL